MDQKHCDDRATACQNAAINGEAYFRDVNDDLVNDSLATYNYDLKEIFLSHHVHTTSYG